MPNVSRVVGLEPLPDFPHGVPDRKSASGRALVWTAQDFVRRKWHHLAGGESGREATAERTIALLLTDSSAPAAGLAPSGPDRSGTPRPFQSVGAGARDGELPANRLVSFHLSAGAGIFCQRRWETDTREVVLPFAKVLEQFAALQVRPDQMADASVPQLETPFLQMTIEDGQRLGTPAAPIAAAVALEPPPATVAKIAAAAPEPIRPIRLTVPNDAKSKGAEAPAPSPIRLNPPLAPSPAAPSPLGAKKISPNGTGVPATERVPASGGPPVPTPSPLAGSRSRPHSI